MALCFFSSLPACQLGCYSVTDSQWGNKGSVHCVCDTLDLGVSVDARWQFHNLGNKIYGQTINQDFRFKVTWAVVSSVVNNWKIKSPSFSFIPSESVCLRFSSFLLYRQRFHTLPLSYTVTPSFPACFSHLGDVIFSSQLSTSRWRRGRSSVAVVFVRL